MSLKKNLSIAAFIACTASGALANGFSTCVSGANSSSCYVPAGITSMNLSITGGGGGGGGGGPALGGGGGAGGGNCKITALSVTPGQLLTISVGAAGQGGAAGTSGTDGYPSSVIYNAIAYEAPGGMGGVTSGAGGLAGAVTTCPSGVSKPGDDGSIGTASLGGVGGVGGDSPLPGAFGGAGGAPNSTGQNGANGAVLITLSVAAPAPIPSLSEWAMIFMASLMAMFGIRRMRRSK